MDYHTEGFYTSPLFDSQGIIHGFGTRSFGMNKLKMILEKRFNLKDRLFIPQTRQVHGTDFRYFKKDDPDILYSGDAWLTDQGGVLCYVKTADCLPLLIYDRSMKVIAAVHCGWRGIAASIITKVLSEMFRRGSRPGDIIAAAGPRIRRNCYKVGGELIDSFQEDAKTSEGIFLKEGDEIYFSLFKAAKEELRICQIREENIDASSLCTYCSDEKFFSYRRDPEENGRHINFIVLE